MNHSLLLVFGATGEPGRRIVERLAEEGHAVRKGSRHADPSFDGRNAHLGDGVRRAPGRERRDFTDYARAAAATGIWKAQP